MSGYRHLKKYDKVFKRRCTCGGKAQMILDIVDDYIVRCSKCHQSTMVHMDSKDAIEAWENNECTGPLELLTDNLEKNFASIKAIYFEDGEFWRVNGQSFDAWGAIVDTGDKLISIEHCKYNATGNIEFSEILDFNRKLYRFKIDLHDENLKLEKIKYYKNGFVEAMRYKWGDYYLFIFSLEDNLAVTASSCDLLEEKIEFVPEWELKLNVIELTQG